MWNTTGAARRGYQNSSGPFTSERRKDNLGSGIRGTNQSSSTVPSREDRVSTIPPVIPARFAPVLHFSSGASGTSLQKDLITAFNRRDYDKAHEILSSGAGSLPKFQEYNLRWLVSSIRGRSDRHQWMELTRENASLPREKAIYAENRAFLYLVNGHSREAQQICKESLREYPTEGLWLNLLVALVLGNEPNVNDTIEEVLTEIAKNTQVGGRFLQLYLDNEPDLARPVCNGG